MILRKLLTFRVFVLITVSVALIASALNFHFQSNSQQKLFTAEELALYNGTDGSRPILLGILGSVFDVSKGKSHYGAGGGYHHFAGRHAMSLLSVMAPGDGSSYRAIDNKVLLRFKNNALLLGFSSLFPSLAWRLRVHWGEPYNGFSEGVLQPRRLVKENLLIPRKSCFFAFVELAKT